MIVKNLKIIKERAQYQIGLYIRPIQVDTLKNLHKVRNVQMFYIAARLLDCLSACYCYYYRRWLLSC